MSTREEVRTAVLGHVADHETYRRQSLNLIASENVVSSAVSRLLASDLVGRYADYRGTDLTARRYTGNQHIVALEQEVAQVARRVFNSAHVELRPLGGHLAGVAVLLAFCQPGDTVLELGREGGGHRMGGRMEATTFSLDVRHLPVDASRFNIDVQGATELISTTVPRLVILGSSNFLFPHPVAEISAAAPEGTVVAFDGSHVMGFLASGRFQDPLAEGADLVFGSTHKTLPGPQGGIIFTNDADVSERVASALTPALVTNHHPFRMPALALALAEMELWGPEYCDEIVRNANALGSALDKRGLRCVRVGEDYTASHTLLIAVSEYGTAEDVARSLESANILSTSALLPDLHGREGIRLGVQEVTRRGADQDAMDAIGDAIAGTVQRSRSSAETAALVREIAAELSGIRFTWPDAEIAAR